MSENNPRKSLLAYSMEGGIWLGLYLTLCFAGNVAALYWPGISAIALLLYIVVPFVLYRIMKRYHRNSNIVNFFSVNWLLGIMLFFFAAIISSIPEYVYYQYINPDYIAQVVSSTLEQLDAMGWMQDDTGIEQVRKMNSEGTLPNAMDMVISQAWSKMFLGSILSIFVSLFVVRIKLKR